MTAGGGEHTSLRLVSSELICFPLGTKLVHFSSAET